MNNSLLKDNESNIMNIINSYLNKCDKCDLLVNETLTNVLSFDNGIKNYDFKDIPGVKLKIKKFCNECISIKTSSIKIYLEI